MASVVPSVAKALLSPRHPEPRARDLLFRRLVAVIVLLTAANPLCGASAQTRPPVKRPAAPPQNDTVWVTPQRGSCDDVSNKISPTAGDEKNYPTTGYEASLARAARLINGGLGAVFYRGAKTVITLVDTSKSEDAIDLISGFPGMPSISRNSLTIEPANWSFLDLLDWYPFVTAQIDSTVAESNVDQVGNRILITATDRKTRDALVQSLRALLLPCHLVAVAMAPAPTFPTRRPETPERRHDRESAN